MWTLVGAGLKESSETMRQMGAVMPRNCTWVKEKVASFDPDQNMLTTDGDKQVGHVIDVNAYLNVKIIFSVS